jgi:photosystem II stability/assembly factor-like uncharacterized protein
VTIAGVAVAAGAGSATEAASNGKCNASIRQAGNNWQEIKPSFADAPSEITQLVLTQYHPDRMWATNGTDVMLTNDAGCRWTAVVHPEAGSLLGSLPAVGDVLPTSPTTTVSKIAAPSSTTTTERVYVGLEDSGLLTDGLRIGYYDGNQWRYDAAGLPSAGHITELAASASSPNVAYVLIEPANALSDGGLYATKDGGENWEQVNASLSSSDISDLSVDPGVPNLLYALGREGVVRSDDGGRNWGVALHAVPDASSYDIASGEGSVQIVQGHSSLRRFDRSRDAGAAWQVAESPVVSRQVAMMPVLDKVAVSDGKNLWIEPEGQLRQAQLVTPIGGPPTQVQFSAPTPAGYAVVGVRGAGVYRSVFDLADKSIRQPLVPQTLLDNVDVKTFPSTLLPRKTALTLPSGGHKTVDYQLILPRTPSQVDVMFLVDTSASMSQTIEGLKKDLADIINELAVAGLDVQFGLGDFKDYSPLWGYGNGEVSDYPYKLDAQISPVGSALRTALNGLRSRGGGDSAESQLTALYQSTTGKGQFYGRHKLVKPGSDAGYRPGALRLAVLATDERFHHEGYYLTPSWATTVAALRASSVHPIGLALNTFNDTDDKLSGFHSLGDEQQLARDTGSLAPRGGVDCNGDLVPDLSAGSPFVCKVPVQLERHFDLGERKTVATPLPVRLAPAISTAASSIADVKPVALTFGDGAVASGRDGSSENIARLLKPTVLPQVNLRTDNTLAYTVQYTCPKLKKPHTYTFDVDAGDGTRTFASSTTRVACGAVPPPPPKRPHPPAEAVAVAAPAAAAAAPPAPGQPVTNGNPNPNPALNANVGFASQEEEQRQLAFATETGFEDDTSTELAMSRLLVGTAALTTLAFGAAYATRRRTQHAHARATWH